MHAPRVHLIVLVMETRLSAVRKTLKSILIFLYLFLPKRAKRDPTALRRSWDNNSPAYN